MTREEFKILVKGLKAVYTQPSFIPDKEAFEVWYGLLADLDYELCSIAIKKHMQTVEKEPTVAGIRKHASELSREEGEINELAAWQMVLKAMRNSTYHSDEEFAKLPSTVQRAVGSPRQLREWAMAENIDGTWVNVTQSNFMRTYRAEIVREKEIRKLSPDLMRLVCKTTEQIPTNLAKRNSISVREERESVERNAVPMPERLREMYRKLIGAVV